MPHFTQRRLRQYAKLLLLSALLGAGWFRGVLPVLADSPAAGTEITNQAFGSFNAADDPAGTTPTTVESNVVKVTVAEVAGITVTAQTLLSNANDGDLVNFEFTITNVGNDPTQFVIPSTYAAILLNGSAGGGSQEGNITIVEYDPDGPSGSTLPTPLSIAVPTESATGSLAGFPNGGSIPSGGNIKVQVPIRLASGLSAGDSITVVLGDTAATDGQNEPYVAGINDVHTQDNSGPNNGDTTGNPVNNEREASARQSVTINNPNQTVDADPGPTWCTVQGGNLSGINLFTPLDNGTLGFESGAPDQSPAANPYPGVVTGGIYAQYGSGSGSFRRPVFGEYSYVANIQNPRNRFQHDGITDPVYGVTGRFFASDPNDSTPTMTITLSGLEPNQFYEYSFWAANSEPGGAPNNVDILIDGETVFSTGPLTAVPAALAWKKYAFTFTNGPNTSITIDLKSTETGSGGNDFYLDNIEVQDCTFAIDYGDAPPSYGDAVHTTIPAAPTVYLGTVAPDSESETPLGGDGGLGADGDDGFGDDEDAFTALPTVPATGTYSLTNIPVRNSSGQTATLHAWIDFNRDGQFSAAEYQSTPVGNGVMSVDLSWAIPADAIGGDSYARFRISQNDLIPDDLSTADVDERSQDAVIAGEAEDYSVEIAPTIATSADYGDAPDPTPAVGSFDYQTTAASNGPSHTIVPDLYIGTAPDGDSGTLEAIDAEADDEGNLKDEGEVVLSLLTVTDTTYSLDNISVTNNTGRQAHLVGWIDYDQNGSFDPDEAATVPVPSAGTQTVDLTWASIPGDIQAGNTYVRLRLTTDIAIATGTASTSQSTGLANDGEVEDYGLGVASSGPAFNGFCYYSDQFEWADYASGGLPVTIGGLEINGGIINTSFANPSTSRSFGIDTGTQGAEAGNFNMSMGTSGASTTAGDYFDFRYTFSPAVSELSFRLIDVDKGGWTDIATVTASYQGNPVPVTLTAEGPNVSVTGNRAEGTAGSASTQTLANVRVDILQPVDTVDIRYGAGTASGQFIWIGDFGLCSSDYSDNPASYGEARHTLASGSSLHLGALAPDDDLINSSLASPDASGDDSNGNDDEDAFTTLSEANVTGLYELTVPVTNTTGGPATLHGWVDFNKDGVFSADEHQGVIVPDGATSADVAWAVPAGTSAGDTFARFRLTTDNLSDNPATALDERAVGAANNGEVEDYPVQITGAPNVLLVKRITEINGDTVTAGGDDLSGYINQGDSTNPYDDNDITLAEPVNPNDPPQDTNQWPTPLSNSLSGGIDGGNVSPNDEIEYTIYYLSSGDTTANDVYFCDYVPEFTSFIPNGYNGSTPQAAGGIGGADLSIEIFQNGARTYHTGANDGDDAVYFAPGIDPAGSFPGIDCDGDPNTANTNPNGAVVVNLGDLPDAATDIDGAYGYVRFRTRVK
ncbi:MAG: GEVED domain-containing protein [Cyanobacteria bacterium P01_D01_bin.14]